MALTISHEVIKLIASSLFEAEERRLRGVVDRIIKHNSLFFPDTPCDGMLFQGKPYDYSNLGTGSRTRVSTHHTLFLEMEEYIKDTETVWGDRHHISQILHGLIEPCSTFQDIRDTLPNCLSSIIPQIASLPRIREEAFTIRDNVRTVRQYRKALPRMEFYSTARLLY